MDLEQRIRTEWRYRFESHGEIHGALVMHFEVKTHRWGALLSLHDQRRVQLGETV